MRPRKIENKNELQPSEGQRERYYIKNIMMSYGIFEDEQTGILPDLFGRNVSPLNIA